jgi:hypothetical protein
MVGLLAAGCMGSVLGLLGAGGSLMTVPILVYLFNVPAVLATSYSLLVVGFTSSLAVIQYQREKMVKWKTAVLFSLPSMTGVGLTRKFVVPAIPESIPVPFLGEINKGQLILLVFAVLVIVVAAIMINDSRKKISKHDTKESKSVRVSNGASSISEVNLGKKLWVVPLEGLIVGAVTGFVGAGGGFLIVPALIYLARLGVQEAVATSLVIIAAKSLFGFAIDLNLGYAIDWSLMAWFCTATSVGVVVGVGLNKRVAPDLLKNAFAWFILLIGVVMVVKELVA